MKMRPLPKTRLALKRTTRPTPAPAQLGFTLTEMMVTVALIGVGTAIALPSLRREADSERAARSVGAVMGESARLAVSRGPIADGSAPIRMRIEGGTVNRLSIWRRGTSATDEEMVTYSSFESDVEIVGYINGAEISQQLVATPTPLSTHVDITCSARGFCQPLTLLFRERDKAKNHYRLVMLPLASSPKVFKVSSGWALTSS